MRCLSSSPSITELSALCPHCGDVDIKPVPDVMLYAEHSPWPDNADLRFRLSLQPVAHLRYVPFKRPIAPKQGDGQVPLPKTGVTRSSERGGLSFSGGPAHLRRHTLPPMGDGRSICSSLRLSEQAKSVCVLRSGRRHYEAVTLGEGGGFILSASPVLYSLGFSGGGAPFFQPDDKRLTPGNASLWQHTFGRNPAESSTSAIFRQ